MLKHSLAIAGLIAATTALALATAAEPTAIDAGKLRDATRVSIGKEVRITFASTDKPPLRPRPAGRAGTDRKPAVEISLSTTDASPVPVRGVATRPFLSVSNGFSQTLHFRVATRLKGSRTFYEMERSDLEAVSPIAPGEGSMKCWESGSQVEEVLLYGFELKAGSP